MIIKSKYLAVSPVMDNTEQLKFEAMGDLDILISKRKLLKTWCTWGYQGAQEALTKLDVLGGTKELKSFGETMNTWGYQGTHEILIHLMHLGLPSSSRDFEKDLNTWGYQGVQGILIKRFDKGNKTIWKGRINYCFMQMSLKLYLAKYACSDRIHLYIVVKLANTIQMYWPFWL